MNFQKRNLFVLILMFALFGCTPQAVEPTSTTAPTMTSLPPTNTVTPTSQPTETPAPTSTPAPTQPSCSVALNPTNNTTVPAKGPFDFQWAPFQGASSYVVAIGPSDWYPTRFQTTDTTLTRYMETFPVATSYQWYITAINNAGQEMCTTEHYSFSTSKALYATPSFAGGNIVQPTTSGQQNTQGSNPSPQDAPDRDINISLVSINDETCALSVDFAVTSTYPIATSLLRYTTDPSETTSSDFCFIASGVNLWPWGESTSLQASIYHAEFDLSTHSPYHHFENGETVYLMAKFIDSNGVVKCSKLFKHQVTTACSGR